MPAAPSCSPRAEVSVASFAYDVWQLSALTSCMDKLAKLVQFQAQAGHVLLRYWRLSHVLLGTVRAMQVSAACGKLSKGLSSTRKTMRLLKVLKSVQDVSLSLVKTRERSTLYRFIHAATYCSSGGYYLLDHVLWGMDVQLFGVVSTRRREVWKRWKNWASVLRLFCRFWQIISAMMVFWNEEELLWLEVLDLVARLRSAEARRIEREEHAVISEAEEEEEEEEEEVVEEQTQQPVEFVDHDPEHHRHPNHPHHLLRRLAVHASTAAISDELEQFHSLTPSRRDFARTTATLHDVALRLRLLRQRTTFLSLDLLEWIMNLALLGKSLKWFGVREFASACCGMTAAGIGIYRIWLSLHSSSLSSTPLPPLETKRPPKLRSPGRLHANVHIPPLSPASRSHARSLPSSSDEDEPESRPKRKRERRDSIVLMREVSLGRGTLQGSAMV